MYNSNDTCVFSMEGNDLQHIDPPQFSYLRELRSVSSYQSDMRNMSLQLFWGAPALHRLCLSVSSAVGCGNWSVCVGACSPLDYLKTRSLSLCCILLRDTAYRLAGKSCSEPCARACGKTRTVIHFSLSISQIV